MAVTKAFQEIMEFIAADNTPEAIVAFRPSEAARAHVADLLTREKTVGLNVEEKSELDQYVRLEHLIRLAKAQARQFLAGKGANLGSE